MKETNQGQIWIEGNGTPAEMRGEAKEDESYHQHSLKYISSPVAEAIA